MRSEGIGDGRECEVRGIGKGREHYVRGNRGEKLRGGEGRGEQGMWGQGK